jgi:hypothetical protein
MIPPTNRFPPVSSPNVLGPFCCGRVRALDTLRSQGTALDIGGAGDRASQQLDARTDVGQHVVSGAVGLTVFDLRRLRLLPGTDPVEQLPDQAECVDLIVMGAGREAQQLGPQVGKPRCAVVHI